MLAAFRRRGTPCRALWRGWRGRFATIWTLPPSFTVADAVRGGLIVADEASTVARAVVRAVIGGLAVEAFPTLGAVAPVVVDGELLGSFDHGGVGFAGTPVKALETLDLLPALTADVGAASLDATRETRM